MTLTTSDEAVPCERQIEKPCHDCPFARAAIPGWLGELSVEQWIAAVHGESQVQCHALAGPQCAGAAIYRANVAKRPRSRALLVLPSDHTAVFSSPVEFAKHHETPGLPPAAEKNMLRRRHSKAFDPERAAEEAMDDLELIVRDTQHVSKSQAVEFWREIQARIELNIDALQDGS